MSTGDAYSSRHLVPSHLGLANVLLAEAILIPELVIFPEYFLDFAYYRHVVYTMSPFSTPSRRRGRPTQIPWPAKMSIPCYMYLAETL